MAKVFSIVNAKGGVAKTTSTLNIGYALSKLGQKVLLVDLDAQANLTLSVGLPNDAPLNISDALTDKCKLADIIHPVNGIEIINSGRTLIEKEHVISNSVTGAVKLKSLLKKIKGNYDYILMDCPPSLGIYTVSALVACDAVYVPMAAEPFAWDGLSRLLETIAILREEEINPHIDLGGLFFTSNSNNAQTILGKTIIQEAREQLGEKVLQTAIRINVALRESVALKQSIYDYAPDSNGARDYMELTKEIIKH
jgi:chromosome partitioning protein